MNSKRRIFLFMDWIVLNAFLVGAPYRQFALRQIGLAPIRQSLNQQIFGVTEQILQPQV